MSKAVGLFLLLGSMLVLRAEDEPAEIVDTDQSPYHQALLNYKSGHDDVALTAIEAAEKAKPGDIPTEILKARILTDLHQFDEAVQVLKNLDGKTDGNPAYNEARILAFGDLLLRQHHFDEAAKYYESLLAAKPDNPDVTLKLIYTRVGAFDFVSAGKYLVQLKPLDTTNPSYYFAKAALAQATGKTDEAEQDIQTVRTIYGITIANRYLKTYFEVFATNASPSVRAEPPSTNAPTTPAKQP